MEVLAGGGAKRRTLLCRPGGVGAGFVLDRGYRQFLFSKAGGSGGVRSLCCLVCRVFRVCACEHWE